MALDSIIWAGTDAPGGDIDTVVDRGRSRPNPVSPAVQANYCPRSIGSRVSRIKEQNVLPGEANSEEL